MTTAWMTTRTHLMACQPKKIVKKADELREQLMENNRLRRMCKDRRELYSVLVGMNAPIVSLVQPDPDKFFHEDEISAFASKVAENQFDNKERTKELMQKGMLCLDTIQAGWAIGAAYLVHFGKASSTVFASSEASHMESLTSTPTWEIAGNIIGDTMPAVLLEFSSKSEPMEGEIYSMTMAAWETLVHFSKLAQTRSVLEYSDVAQPRFQDACCATSCIPCRPFPDLLSDDTQSRQFNLWKISPEQREVLMEAQLRFID